MTDNQSQLRLSFLQLLILLGVQVALLSGAFYLGARVGGGFWTPSKAPVKDQDLAKLLPQSGELVTSDGKSEKLGTAPTDANRPSSTPFDKSSSTVFRIKSSSNSEYTVQVASYPDESAAVQVVDEWKKKGYMAFLSVQDLPDKGKWYRVNVGNFGDEAAAQGFAKTIETKEHVTPQVIVNE